MNFKKFCWFVLKPYRFYILLMFFTGILWGLYTSTSPYLLKIVIDKLTSTKSVQQAYLPAIGYVVLYFMATLNFRLLDWIKYKILPPIKKDTAMLMFNYIKEHSRSFFQDHFAGSLSNKVNDMVVNLESLVKYFEEFLANLASFAIAIAFMYAVHPAFAATLFAWWLIFLIVSTIFSKYIYKISQKTSEAHSKYTGTLVDILGNMPSVRLFARFNLETNNLSNDIDDLVDKDRNMQKYIIKMHFMQDTSLVILLGVMFYILLNLYQSNLVSIGDFALILTITMSIFQHMWHLASNIIEVYRSFGKCLQANALLEIEHEIIDKPNAKALELKSGTIEFKNVCFAYKNAKPLFINKNITIAAGSKVGLVGYSGSGKSSFVNLILRLYDIQSGAIFIDGQDISSVSQHSLRSNISLIPQDISLFHRTIRENIGYGNVNASEEEIITASKKAHCHEFISNLSKGYETFVGERGVKLSGGQRQRIAIARAMLENAPILILDEATSSLDSITEQYIQESLHLAMQNRTTIVVAHRLSTLLAMDRILVFENGKIVEDGSHTKLLELNGKYAQMWQMQSDGFLPN